MILSFAQALLRRLPPWLRRWSALPLGLGDPFDALATSTANALVARFPTASSDPPALALIGAERRIVRGPGESASTYASRLRIWLDSHRTRGGGYALLDQLFAYWRSALGVQIDVVAASGGREIVDANGVITHDAIAWTGGGDLAAFWAQDWIFFHMPSSINLTVIADTGEEIATPDDVVIASVPLSFFAGVLPETIAESFRVVPRQWAPAHLKRCTIVLLWANGFVYGYPPGPTYGDGHVYGGSDQPIRLVINF